MRLRLQRIAPLALIAALLSPGAGSLLPQDDEIEWLTYPEALKEAKRIGKPLFVEFRCEP
jgi:hypothetical protein